METAVDCIPCIINQGLRNARSTGMDEEALEVLTKELLKHLATVDLKRTSPDISRDVWEIVVKHTGNEDPYKGIKEKYNKAIMDMEGRLKDLINKSDKQFITALKLAITGNIIDFGPKLDLSEDVIMDKINKIENTPLAIDHSEMLFQQLLEAKTLFYIGDNCGEVIFDKIFITYLKLVFPQLKLFFGVRGKAVINDVTREDALFAGIDKLGKIVDSGDGSPGTIPERTKESYLTTMKKSDVIIAKGQGNFESLSEFSHKGLFFLFMAKCSIVADYIGTDTFSLVCKKAGK